MRNVKSSGDGTCMVCPGNFFAWGMRYVFRPFEKIICKLEPGWEAEVARSVKHHRYGTRMVCPGNFLFCVEREICAQTPGKINL